jgi:very-short-patch-repair endonuclease
MPNENARRLRRDAIEAERRLWTVLRDRRLAGYRFRRQHPIGACSVDFACTRYRLVVEADGGQHAESSADDNRTAFLQRDGWRVLRFWNNDIRNTIDAVIETILRSLREEETLTRSRTAPATTPSRGAGEGFHRASGPG